MACNNNSYTNWCSVPSCSNSCCQEQTQVVRSTTTCVPVGICGPTGPTAKFVYPQPLKTT
jgi:hypothetical protein